MRGGIAAAALWLGVAACGDDGSTSDTSTGSTGTPATSDAPTTEAGSTSAMATTAASTSGADSSGGPGNTSTTTDAATDSTGAGAGTSSPPLQFVAVTFNTGGHADGEADVADQEYGNGLSWTPAVEQTTAWFASLQPEVVVFQEIFYSPDCQNIDPQFHPGYVCESWSPGDPTVAQVVLGPGYQIACNLGKTDKCAAVRTDFGSFVGCDADFCLDGLDGAQVPDCGGGSRVGRGVIDLVDGGQLTIVNFHGTSGFLPADQLCRVAQVEQVFLDLDGQPAANGDRNLILGDLNTDPGRAELFDLSAARWNDFVGGNEPFDFITDVGNNATPTYAGTLNIDHQVSDWFVGNCWHPGVTPGYDAVVDFSYYDHVPAVCLLSEPAR